MDKTGHSFKQLHKTQENRMNKISLVDESLEASTQTSIIQFFETIDAHGTSGGENMNRKDKHYFHDIAATVVRLIKTGGVPNTDFALIYCINKIGLEFNPHDKNNRLLLNIMLNDLRDYNGGNKIILNRREKFAVHAANKEVELYQTEKNLTFAKADLRFDEYKRAGAYPHVSLLEGNTPIRTYQKDNGEKRDIRYEGLNGLNRILTPPENITYKDIDIKDGYVFHHDSGHGWLEVPVQEIKAMGFEERITPYSYLDRDKAYLEKNIDSGTFLDIRKLLPKPFIIKNNYMNGMCPIRDLPHYKPENVMPGKKTPTRKAVRSKDIEWER
jgi:hypothetical protein